MSPSRAGREVRWSMWSPSRDRINGMEARFITCATARSEKQRRRSRLYESAVIHDNGLTNNFLSLDNTDFYRESGISFLSDIVRRMQRYRTIRMTMETAVTTAWRIWAERIHRSGRREHVRNGRKDEFGLAIAFIKYSQFVGGTYYPAYYQQPTTLLKPPSSFAPRQMEFSMRLNSMWR
jgi:hypothetical protein